MSQGIFARANAIVVEDGLEAIEYAAVQEGAGDSSAPTLSTDGVPLLGSARAVILGRPSSSGGATTFDLQVWIYIATSTVAGWFSVDSSVLEGLTLARAESMRVGKAIQRVFVQVLNSDGNVDVYVGRTT